MPSITADKLLAEKTKLEKQITRARKQYEAAAKRLHVVEQSLRLIRERDRLTPLVGIPGGVKCSYRRASSENNAWLNTACGTLTKVGRTRAHVDFADHGQWTFPLTDIVAAGERQAVTFAAMAAGDMGD